MNIALKCFATLAEADKCDYRSSATKSLSEGATVGRLMEQAGIAEKDVQLIFVNGRKAAFDTVLRDGDQVGLAPATGGM